MNEPKPQLKRSRIACGRSCPVLGRIKTQITFLPKHLFDCYLSLVAIMHQLWQHNTQFQGRLLILLLRFKPGQRQFLPEYPGFKLQLLFFAYAGFFPTYVNFFPTYEALFPLEWITFLCVCGYLLGPNLPQLGYQKIKRKQ